LFADVCDSTAIYETAGDAPALSLINRLFDLLGKEVKARGGAVVKTLGDGMVCRFRSAQAALRAACDMQVATAKLPGVGQHKLAIRIGCTYGPVVLKGGDVFGDTVNVCSRLVALGNPGQVLTTRQTVDALPALLRERCRELYSRRVRGRAREVKVWEVLWRSDPDMTELNLSSEMLARPQGRVLRLSYGGDSVALDASGVLQLGRDKANDVVITSTLASRVHARIFGRDGNFVIADQSANGTFLLVDGNAQELRLRREEALMGEGGSIGLGKPVAGHGPHVLRYRLEPRSG
jgi:adenylate cyclase